MQKNGENRKLFLSLFISIILCVGLISFSYAASSGNAGASDSFLSVVWDIIKSIFRFLFGGITGFTTGGEYGYYYDYSIDAEAETDIPSNQVGSAVWKSNISVSNPLNKTITHGTSTIGTVGSFSPIPTVENWTDEPFYTTSNNPITLSPECLLNLSAGSGSCTVLWAVYATGPVCSSHNVTVEFILDLEFECDRWACRYDINSCPPPDQPTYIYAHSSEECGCDGGEGAAICCAPCGNYYIEEYAPITTVTIIGYEFCNGIDDDCDGQIDEVPDINIYDPNKPNCSGVCPGVAVCSGGSWSCDYSGSAGTLCRAAAGICDVAEYCNGASSQCPADDYMPYGTICRTAEGDCDEPEWCTGNSPTCPIDSVKGYGTICRYARDDCDAEEICDGVNKNCPADAKQPYSTSCNDEQFCSAIDHCDGLGSCIPLTARDCSDNVGCTDDSCDEINDRCVNTPNSANCPADEWYDTGNTRWVSTDQCTEKEQKEQQYRDYYCDAILDCQYNIIDTQWIDTSATRNKPDGTACDDSAWCTINDQCKAGVCSGTARDCSDNVGCTDDRCDEINDECVHTPNDNYCPTDEWVNIGESYWVNIGACDRELRQDQEYRNYYCDPINDCRYAVTEFRYIILQYEHNDDDNDGVCNVDDKCPGTILPESVPTNKLLVWHYANVDTDNIFETRYSPTGPIVDSQYTLTDTYGCTCEQILECKPGNNEGEYKFGCSPGTMHIWTHQIGWAPDCQWQKPDCQRWWNKDCDGDGHDDNGCWKTKPCYICGRGEDKPPLEDTNEDTVTDPLDPDNDGDGIPDNEDAEDDSQKPAEPDKHGTGKPDWWCRKHPGKC